jgi:hypothetical protein
VKLIRLLCASIASLFRPAPQAALNPMALVKIRVSMSCIGPDGKQKWADPRPVKTWWTDRGEALILAGLAILALLWKRPELLFFAPMRVTTAGLNQLLDATLKTGGSSPVWYVGLIKAVATDGAINSASQTLTSASNPFASGDVGRRIIVRGAGSGGADLNTTISAYGSAGSVTLTDSASTTVTGAAFAFEPRAADVMSSHAGFVESTAYSNANRPAWTPGSISGGSVDNSGSVAAFTINGSDYIFGAFLVNNNTKGGTTGILYGGGLNASGIARQVANSDTLNVTLTPSLTSA